MKFATIATLLTATLGGVGCKSSGNAEPVLDAAEDPSGACAGTRFHLTGTIGNTQVSQAYKRGAVTMPTVMDEAGFALDDAGLRPGLAVDFASNGNLSLRLGDGDANQVSRILSAVLILPNEGPNAGNTLCIANGSSGSVKSEYTRSEIARTFVLKELSIGPVCPGTPITGELVGCWGWDAL